VNQCQPPNHKSPADAPRIHATSSLKLEIGQDLGVDVPPTLLDIAAEMKE
jgi:hypothetical protein